VPPARSTRQGDLATIFIVSGFIVAMVVLPESGGG
jgi:hypothetical protein